ncbi:hypothetical protein SO802_015411 [Lithocarpus litseifolius]|uniref:Ethylene insensitive 3-like DNA-binding domain-containing protein n=1 Tax=Lithocarpus litseifolius TaxID=425828 RepID=A0AAW2CXR9_9ROSI
MLRFLYTVETENVLFSSAANDRNSRAACDDKPNKEALDLFAQWNWSLNSNIPQVQVMEWTGFICIVLYRLGGSRAQDEILKYMLKLMEVCKALGFVYGIIPKKGKPVSGASDNIRAWWKEKVKFDKNGLAVIAKYEAKCLAISEAENNQNGNFESVLQDLQDSTLGSLLSS